MNALRATYTFMFVWDGVWVIVPVGEKSYV